MNAAWIASLAQLRRRRAATVGLILLVCFAGGVVLAAVAGASRTDSAMDRFVAYNRPVDLAVVVNDPALRRKVASLSEVAGAGESVYLFLASSKSGSDLGTLSAFAMLGDAERSVRRPRLLAGRLPRPDRPFEAVANPQAAR